VRDDDEPALLSFAEDVPERPRGAVHTQAAVRAATDALREALDLDAKDTLTLDASVAEGALFLTLAARSAGAAFVAETPAPGVDATRALERTGRATLAVMRTRSLTNHGERLIATRPCLRAVVGIGAPIPPAVTRALVEAARRHGTALEVASATTVREVPSWLALTLHAPIATSTARMRGGPLAGTDVALTSDGRLRVRGPAIPRTYTSTASDVRSLIDDEGWLSTHARGEREIDGLVRPPRAPAERTALDLLDALLPPLRADSPWRDHVRERPRDYPLGCGRGASLAFEAALKPMLRELLEESSIESARARFEHAGFVTELSPLAFGPTRDGWLGTFESRAEAAGDRSRVRRPLYVGRVRSTLREAIDAEVARTADGARTLGRLLGYPRCCVEAFVVAPDRRASRLWAAAAARSTRFAPRLDVLDHSIFSYIGFFPCRFDCPEALAQADAVAALIARSHPEFVATIDDARAQTRLVLAPEVQLIVERRVGSPVAFRAAARERDPRVPLDAREVDLTARALARLEGASTCEIEEGALRVDGRDLLRLDPPLPLLLPFAS
jgi:hypothetical protein